MSYRDTEREFIKQQLEEELFQSQPFKSQKETILQKVLEKERPKKRTVWYHYGLTAVAVLLLTGVSAMFVYQHMETKESTASPTEKDPLHSVGLEPQDADNVEKTVPSTEEEQWDKTAEEWREYFIQFYQEADQILPYTTLHLKMEKKVDGEVFETETQVDKSGNQLQYHQAIKGIGQSTWNQESYLTGQEYTTVNHLTSQYESIHLDETSDVVADDQHLFRFEPMDREAMLTRLEFDGATWKVLEVNKPEHWVTLESTNTQRANEPFTDRATLKIDYQTGVLLEVNEYNQETLMSYMKVTLLETNQELSNQYFTPMIPSEYENKQELAVNRLPLDETWFTGAAETLKSNYPNLMEALYSGEGSYFTLILTMKEGTSEDEAKQAGETYFNIVTQTANESDTFTSKNTTIWSKGQYSPHILVEIENTIRWKTGYENGQFNWTSEPYIKVGN